MDELMQATMRKVGTIIGEQIITASDTLDALIRMTPEEVRKYKQWCIQEQIRRVVDGEECECYE